VKVLGIDTKGANWMHDRSNPDETRNTKVCLVNSTLPTPSDRYTISEIAFPSQLAAVSFARRITSS
jgi:hypothetical protein